jgi:hypothetical protein
MKPLVLILIPAYNAEEWISQTIESEIAQTWSHKEIMVGDDGSTDRTVDVAQRVRVEGSRNRFQRQRRCSGDAQSCLAPQPRRLSNGWMRMIFWPQIRSSDSLALRENDSRRILLSSAWAQFNYRIGGLGSNRLSFGKMFLQASGYGESGRLSVYADGYLADEQGASRGSRTLGQTLTRGFL